MQLTSINASPPSSLGGGGEAGGRLADGEFDLLLALLGALAAPAASGVPQGEQSTGGGEDVPPGSRGQSGVIVLADSAYGFSLELSAGQDTAKGELPVPPAGEEAGPNNRQLTSPADLILSLAQQQEIAKGQPLPQTAGMPAGALQLLADARRTGPAGILPDAGLAGEAEGSQSMDGSQLLQEVPEKGGPPAGTGVNLKDKSRFSENMPSGLFPLKEPGANMTAPNDLSREKGPEVVRPPEASGQPDLAGRGGGQAEGPKSGEFQPAQALAGANPAQPTPPDTARSVGLPGLKDRIVQEIRHVFIMHKGEPQTRVHLKLEPEHLGRLTIKLFFHRGEINAHFYTGSDYVKEVLENSLAQLREVLGQQELKLNEALVFTGGGGRGGMERYFEDSPGEAADSGRPEGSDGEVRQKQQELLLKLNGPVRVDYLV